MKYSCEFCGTPYDTEEECKKCEAFHVEPSGVEACIFRPIGESDNRYIDGIVLKMKDGKAVLYKFDSIIENNKDDSQNGEAEQ